MESAAYQQQEQRPQSRQRHDRQDSSSPRAAYRAGVETDVPRGANVNEFPKYRFWRWRNFIEVVGWSPFTHLDQATINWAMEKAAKEIEKPGRRAAFIYGVANITDDGGKSRVFFETNTGGEN